eukprot:4033120-Alexandrium_andersonii.AAC.1
MRTPAPNVDERPEGRASSGAHLAGEWGDARRLNTTSPTARPSAWIKGRARARTSEVLAPAPLE